MSKCPDCGVHMDDFEAQRFLSCRKCMSTVPGAGNCRINTVDDFDGSDWDKRQVNDDKGITPSREQSYTVPEPEL